MKNNLAGWYFTISQLDGTIHKSMHNSPKTMPFHASLSPSLETHPVKLMHEKQSSGTVLYNFTNRWHNPQINAQVPKNPCGPFHASLSPSLQTHPVKLMHENSLEGACSNNTSLQKQCLFILLWLHSCPAAAQLFYHIL